MQPTEGHKICASGLQVDGTVTCPIRAGTASLPTTPIHLIRNMLLQSHFNFFPDNVLAGQKPALLLSVEPRACTFTLFSLAEKNKEELS